MGTVANPEGDGSAGAELLMGRKKRHQQARVRPSRPVEDGKVIEWDLDECATGAALPVLQLYRWSDLVRLSDKVAPLLRQGVGDSSPGAAGGESNPPNRVVGEKGE